MTNQPLVVYGNFCVYCCIALGWASETLLHNGDEPPDFDDDDYEPDDELAD